MLDDDSDNDNHDDNYDDNHGDNDNDIGNSHFTSSCCSAPVFCLIRNVQYSPY